MNDIGRVALTLQKPLVCDVYDSHQGTGAFVLIDEATHHTVAAGMIRAFRPERRSAQVTAAPWARCI